MRGITLGDDFSVEFVSADSLGARSMATLVRAGGVSIFIDPSVALGPKRYGYPPHRLELEEKEKSWMRIEERLKGAHVVLVTHYHYDHYNPRRCELLLGKRLIIKDPLKNINKSQRFRSKVFLEALGSLGGSWEVGDGKVFEEGGVVVSVSPPFPHGATDKLGYVLEVSVSYRGRKFLFTSDVQGPCREDQVSFIVSENPDVVYCDGPMTYMIGYAYSQELLDASVRNLKRVLEETDVQLLVLDHHLTRDRRFLERVADVVELGEKLGKKVTTAAEAMGFENRLLEAFRKELYKGTFKPL